MKNHRTTIHDIARELKIDSSTVSRALNNNSKVTAKTKAKVIAKAKELGYQRNLLASNLRQSKSNTIGVVVPRISRYFFSTVIAGIEESAFKTGFNVVICQSQESLEKEQAIIKNLISNRVDGVIISIAMETQNGEHLKQLKNNGIPLVFFDRFCPEVQESSQVLIDDQQAAYDAVNHLISQGCSKIVHFSGPQTLEIYKNRLRGYKLALLENNLPFKEELVINSPLMEANGYEETQKLLDAKIDFDGIFSANDIAAIGALKHLKEKGKRIPEDIAVIGFSNEPSSKVIEPPLSTIDQSAFEIGKNAYDLLIDNIKRGEKEVLHKTITLKSTLLARGSSLRKK
ncbi:MULTISPECIES: LacI family DNA-binding transcriptional regulator [Salegentibacter]|uniref:LacI family DNA-binding transcriptional regulator n=1 Tax=Salegentibacter maritimus TaxID=2794347 RepID=A0ABS0TJQ2_9FLAO|nr:MULTISPECIES: LacI family DNA-binding transcriptional regulator [Salegentibacter]MBE7640564.1 substrate-binding domain-containing protein [Salegentibacter sp. BLCTC]MBI6115912.1 LacI family DNA-binding transcriptional regulator [Salegentibacter maritimus]MBI6121261.1 LacI family DNA-binding transcriptional regulator [Salegentibacter maritimus]